MHQRDATSEAFVIDLPPASSLDRSLEEEEESDPGISGEGRMHGDIDKGAEGSLLLSSHSWNNQLGGRLSRSRGSHSCSRLAWSLQVKNGSSCLQSVRMRKCSSHLPPLIQGHTGWRGKRHNTGLLVIHEQAVSPTMRGRTSVSYLILLKLMGAAGTMCVDSLFHDSCFLCFVFKLVFSFGPLVCALTLNILFWVLPAFRN